MLHILRIWWCDIVPAAGSTEFKRLGQFLYYNTFQNYNPIFDMQRCCSSWKGCYQRDDEIFGFCHRTWIFTIPLSHAILLMFLLLFVEEISGLRCDLCSLNKVTIPPSSTTWIREGAKMVSETIFFVLLERQSWNAIKTYLVDVFRCAFIECNHWVVQKMISKEAVYFAVSQQQFCDAALVTLSGLWKLSLKGLVID